MKFKDNLVCAENCVSLINLRVITDPCYLLINNSSFLRFLITFCGSSDELVMIFWAL